LIVGRTTEQFVTAIGFFYQLRVTESGDDPVTDLKCLKRGGGSGRFINFHADSMAWGLGQRLSEQNL
jgi:hypothetical protein